MKPATLLLSASLCANAALVAYVALRPADSSRSAPPARSSGSTSSIAGGSHSQDALRAALASGDAAALEAAGVSPEIARQLALGRIFSRLGERAGSARAGSATDGKWWRSRATNPGAREQQLVSRRELSDALMAAFGDDFGLLGGDASALAFLPTAKRDALRRINQDYDEMMAKFSAGGVQLASDKEKLRLLKAERDRDIAALLTPAEREAYEMRTSPSALAVRSRYGDAIETEAEFQAIYALQKAFDEKHPRDALVGRVSPETLRGRADAERQLGNDIRAAVGDDRYAALRRASDYDVRTVDSLVSRLNLPASTTDTVLATREALAAESQRIAANAAVPMTERRAQIQELAGRAKSDLTRALGAEAAEAYAQRSPWMSMLQGGMAYSTTPQPGSPGTLFSSGQSVHPVMPAGATPASGNAVRQTVVSAVPGTFDMVHTGNVEAIAGAPGNVQVMTFSTSSTTPADPTTGTPVRRVMVGSDTTTTPAPGTTPPPGR